MTSPTYPVWEGDGGANDPKWPDEGDFGGLEFEDNPNYPPTDRKRLSATDYMQVEMSLARACRMIPPLMVDFSPGYAPFSPDAPVVHNVQCVNDALTTTTLAINRADVGEYVISFDSGLLPPVTMRPRVEQCGVSSALSLGGYVSQTTISGTTYFFVTVFDSSGAETDDPAYSFRLICFGE